MLLEPVDDSRTDAFTRALSSGDPVQISTSRPLAFNDLAIGLERVDGDGSVEVLTDDDTATELRDHFLTRTTLSRFTQNETLEIRSQSTPLPTLLLSDEEATAVTGFTGTKHVALETADEAFVEETSRTFGIRFDEATTVNLRTPPYSVLLGELEEWFNADVRADFEAALQAAQDSNLPSLSLHPATINILVGALHQLEYYEVGRWSEDIQLVSKATLSRKKNELEETGVIDTESIQGRVGRPRHRLLIGEAIGATEEIGEIVAEVTDR